MSPQQKLPFPKRGKVTIRSRSADYDARNLESARYVQAHPEQFGGADSGQAAWARAVIARLAGRNIDLQK